MSDTSYIEYGFDSYNKTREETEARRAVADAKFALPWRFWLKKGEKKRFVFLDDVPAVIHEWSLFLNGRWGNHFTCTRHKNGYDPFSALPESAKAERKHMGFLTGIEIGEFQDKSGKTHKNVRRVLAMTSTMIRKVEGWKEDRGSLVGCVFIVKRTTDEKAPRIGDDWQFLEKVDLSTILDADGIPVDTSSCDYNTLLKAHTPAETYDLLLNAGYNTYLPPELGTEHENIPAPQSQECNNTVGDTDIPF